MNIYLDQIELFTGLIVYKLASTPYCCTFHVCCTIHPHVTGAYNNLLLFTSNCPRLYFGRMSLKKNLYRGHERPFDLCATWKINQRFENHEVMFLRFREKHQVKKSRFQIQGVSWKRYFQSTLIQWRLSIYPWAPR